MRIKGWNGGRDGKKEGREGMDRRNDVGRRREWKEGRAGIKGRA